MRFKIFFWLISFFLTLNIYSQAILPTSRTSWNHSLHPSGWTHTGTVQRTTTFACSGSDGVTFDGTGDRIVLFVDSDIDVLTFKLKSASMSGASFLLIESSPDNVTWSTLGNYGTNAGSTTITTCADISFSPSCGVRYIRWTYTRSSGNCDMDDVSLTKKAPGSCGCLPATEPTLASSTLTVTPTTSTAFISYIRGNGDGVIAIISTDCTITNPSDNIIYTPNLTYGLGSTTNTGDYVVFIGTANSFTINGLSPSTTYCIKLFEFNGTSTCIEYMSSGPNQSLTTTAISINPFLTGILINACDATCSEGNNEIIYGNTADYTVLANSTNLDIRYGSSSPASTTYTDTYVTNPTTTALLNTSCPGTFVEGLGVNMLPGSSFMIVRNTFCPVDYNWSSLCGSGPIYVLYSSDVTWITGGNFDNSGTSPRYFRFNSISTGPISNTVDYTYTPNDNTSSGNGAFITLDSDGGSPVSYLNNGCLLDPIILPIELIDFIGYANNEINHLEWFVASERDNDYYTIEKSIDGLKWEEISKINGYGTSTQQQHYYSYDNNFEKVINYYRLSQTDFNGLKTNLKIIAINNNKPNKTIIRITDIIGRDINIENNNELKIIYYEDGTIEKRY